jgi:hypothetical protein
VRRRRQSFVGHHPVLDSYSILRSEKATAYLQAYRLLGIALRWSLFGDVSAFETDFRTRSLDVNQFTSDACELPY